MSSRPVAGGLSFLGSTTGTRLGAFVDKCTGGKHYEGAASNWSDVRKACEFWAELIGIQIKQDVNRKAEQ